MEIVTTSGAAAPPPGGSAVTIGAYDGVHLGHRALLAELRRRAQADGLATVVVTFDRHPASVVRPDSAPALLCDLDQKLELLASAGVDRTVVIRFDEERANETAEDFVAGELVAGLGARLVVVGEDFHFGHGRKGNVALLTEMGADAGFAVDGVPLSSEDGDGPGALPVSSTRIRDLVASGRVAEAAELLGRPHQVRGPVVTGDRRGGSELGYPTANIQTQADQALPVDGIYATRTRLGDATYDSATYIGTSPTFDGQKRIIEVLLFDFDSDIYGEQIAVEWVDMVRGDRKFPNAEALQAQMAKDVEKAKRVLAEA